MVRWIRLQGIPFAVMLRDHTASRRIGGWVKELPIDSSKKKILGAIRAADVIFTTAETASGKTTRVPQFVLDDQQQRGEPCRTAGTE